MARQNDTPERPRRLAPTFRVWEKRLLVFDLDGTLYEGTEHFDYYAREIGRYLAEDVRAAYERDYANSRSGRGPVKFGDVYDYAKDVLYRREEGGERYRAFRWDGTPLDDVVPASAFAAQDKRYVPVGDGWWLPLVIALHYGVDVPALEKAFLATRAYMQSPAYHLPENPRLKRFFERFKERGGALALLTNSPEEDSRAILRKIGVLEYFDDLVFWAEKPQKTTEHMTRLLERFAVSPELAASIGDNLVNDIVPAKRLGMHTVLVDPHNIAEGHEADLVVPHLTAFLDLACERESYGERASHG
ncbi:MAG: HAD family hydrolase [Brockia lithotrophica]|nr:HAD family hydrolase [Brockia lithotrophica]